ncbi:acetyl-CoA carboxylase, biotin carboxyl carrier protein [Ligilactobacillus pabuli]|uniref:Biotin carboxyl carrier protein of acetyl-CoA carboxylase n=1 Tax=Ligilactobacillus pabuli TaxID=2886039 RepID=A0ABQ5JIC7_9LACO|nr:acetyl-CoA carboxylase biotin carboxyl carrier protein [Ligilactobacillus pabuli]GKS81864.1 acetyl-CoA carboxylase, biotin carboxyl carrier protein [Ligilactobacillus pabuli]HIW88348.1 acetyl-CoA carboxylase biotin carboxyl carrier protein [Candidatus Ligilactobacillus excrementipullorum]
MEFNEIKKLMDEFNSSNTREMEITTEGFHIHLSKNENSFQAEAQIPTPTAAAAVPTNVAEKQPVETKPVEVEEGTVIKAPMVGTVYLKPEPQKPAYVAVGQKVKKGDVICIIEAMKMMTEIKSEVSGTISEVLVENEELVEFDQPLLRVQEA